jgi:DnaJ family protein B protein 12
MESNKDEALRCLSIAQKHYDSGNLPSARKFCQKSKALFETSQADKLLAAIDNAASSSSSSAKSQAEGHPSAAGMKHRSTQSANTNGTAGGMGGEKREYTHEQHVVVKRVRACKVTEYYEILAVSKDCDEADIKKAYRKVCMVPCL